MIIYMFTWFWSHNSNFSFSFSFSYSLTEIFFAIFVYLILNLFQLFQNNSIFSYVLFSLLFQGFFPKYISLFLSFPLFLCLTIAVSLSKSHCLCLCDLCPAARRHVFVLDTRPLTSQARSVTVGVFGGTKAPRVAIGAASYPALLFVVPTAHI